jgi:hypothetical protein
MKLCKSLRRARGVVTVMLMTAVAGLGQSVFASPPITLPVANPSFENPALASGASLNAAIPDWSNTTGSSRQVRYPTPVIPGTHLNQIAEFFGGGAVAQSLGHSIVADATYTVDCLFGWAGGGLSGVVELYAGGTLIDGAVVGGTLLTSDVRVAAAGGDFTMEEFSFNWTAPASGGPVGQNLSIRLGRADAFLISSVAFDNIRVSYVPIPEPASALLLAGAGRC